MPKYIGDLKLYTLNELSERMDLAVITLRKYIRNGKIHARKWGQEWYVSEDEVVDYFRRDENPRSRLALKRRIERADDAVLAQIWECIERAERDDETDSMSGKSRNRT